MLRGLWAKVQGAGVAALVARGSSAALVIKTIGVALQLALHLSLTHLLPNVEQYGMYVYAIALVRTAVLVATLGFSKSSMRFVPQYLVEKDWGALAGFLRRVPPLVTLTSLALIALAGAVTVITGSPFADTTLTLAILACILLPVRSLLEVGAGCLRGFKQIVAPLSSNNIARPAAILVIFGCLYSFDVELTAAMAMAINLAVVAGIVALLYYLLARTTPSEARSAESEPQMRYWIAASLPFLLLTGFSSLSKQIDLIMVGSLLGGESAGLYSVASRVAMFLGIPLGSVNSILAPVVAQLHHEKKHTELQQAVTMATRITFSMTLVGGGLVWFFGDQVLALFGEQYASGALGCLRILVFGQLVNAAAGSVGLLMAMTGNQLQATLVVGGSVLLNVVLNLVLVPHFGIEGAAIATAIALAAWNIVLILRVRKILGIRALAH